MLAPRHAGHTSEILSRQLRCQSMSQRGPMYPIAELGIAENVTIHKELSQHRGYGARQVPHDLI